MSYIYIELWTAKEAWKRLPENEKVLYLEKVKPLIRAIAQRKEVKLIAMAKDEGFYPDKSGHTYAAVWLMPSIEACENMESVVDQIEWNKFFDQVNFRARALDGDAILQSYLGEVL